MKVHLTGATGRLGRVVAGSLLSRGDDLVPYIAGINYLIFAHRYRGDDDYTKEMSVNLGIVQATITCANWGEGDKAIVLVSSVSASNPAPHQSLAYNLSKAGLNQMARYYAKKGIVRINTVSPDTFTGEHPVVTPQEVANVILFLCSPQASGISGQDLVVSR